MNRPLIATLLVILAAFFAACSGSDSATPTPEPTQTTARLPTPTPEAEATPSPTPTRISRIEALNKLDAWFSRSGNYPSNPDAGPGHVLGYDDLDCPDVELTGDQAAWQARCTFVAVTLNAAGTEPFRIALDLRAEVDAFTGEVRQLP